MCSFSFTLIAWSCFPMWGIKMTSVAYWYFSTYCLLLFWYYTIKCVHYWHYTGRERLLWLSAFTNYLCHFDTSIGNTSDATGHSAGFTIWFLNHWCHFNLSSHHQWDTTDYCVITSKRVGQHISPSFSCKKMKPKCCAYDPVQQWSGSGAAVFRSCLR